MAAELFLTINRPIKSPQPHARGLFFSFTRCSSPTAPMCINNQPLNDPQNLAYAEAERWAEA
jgi:hypothetical protein